MVKVVRTAVDKQKKFLLIAQGILFAAFLGMVIYASFKFAPAVTRLISQPDKFREFLTSYGPVSAMIYILVSALHIIIAVIPGEIVQMAGGYAFGTPLGTVYAVAGTILGTVIVFVATRLLGFSLVKALISPKTLEKFGFLINTPKFEIAIFVLFLIPGIPKDTLVYISGLTPIKPLRFLLICTIARFPGILGSAYIGANIQEKDYLSVWIMIGIASVLFVIGVLFRDKIIDRLHRLRHPGKDAPPERRS
jgi:uncharacterized membrane protein YdjX (TVP38/TMEM64 family)